MAVFRPTVLRNRITDVTAEDLKALGVRALLLDVDNTIATFTSHQPIEGVKEWMEKLSGEGYRIVIVSNNYKKRVSAFAARFGVAFISFAVKPLPFGYLRAKVMLKVRRKECAIIGDQIFTDVIGANLCGMKSFLLTPIEPEEGWSFRIRRFFERPLREKYEKQPGRVLSGGGDVREKERKE